MTGVVFAVPGSLDTPTGGYAYDRHIIDGLRAAGWRVDVFDLGAGFPFPDQALRAAALAQFDAIDAGRIVVVDGLALGVLQDAAARLASKHRLVALVHHPLALETGLGAEAAADLRDSERAALAHAHAVIVTSDPTRQLLIDDYDVPAQRISVVPPGVEAVSTTTRAPRDDVHLLSVGSLVRRKGYDVLIAALADVSDLPWRLTIAGDATRDPETTAQIRGDIAARGLEDRISLTGAIQSRDLQRLYTDADVFVLASYFEGYGMVFGEAIAHGLPVVATRVGDAGRIVPEQAGILVAPGDVAALTAALRVVIVSRARRNAMRAAARIAATQLPDWTQSAALFARVLEQVA